MAAAACDTPFNFLKRGSDHLNDRHALPSAFFSPMVNSIYPSTYLVISNCLSLPHIYNLQNILYFLSRTSTSYEIERQF